MMSERIKISPSQRELFNPIQLSHVPDAGSLDVQFSAAMQTRFSRFGSLKIDVVALMKPSLYLARNHQYYIRSIWKDRIESTPAFSPIAHPRRPLQHS